LPTTFKKTITHPNNNEYAESRIVSSARKQSNGNTLIFAGDWGYVYELNTNGDVVWEYRIPFNNGFRIEQGFDPAEKLNLAFKFIRYPLEYEAFNNKDLTPSEYLELSPNDELCLNVSSTEELSVQASHLFPNPVFGQTTLYSHKAEEGVIYNFQGKVVQHITLVKGLNTMSFESMSSGIYFIKLKSKILKFIKI